MKEGNAMNRKVISVVAALAMLLSSFSVSFAATDSATTSTDQGKYKDVNGHWASEAIYKWSGYGVIKGNEGLFRPNDPITRGEIAVILNNIMDYQAAAKNTFKDLKAGKFYTDAILKLNASGIMMGDGATLIRPTDKITREEAAVVIAKAFAVNEGTVANTKFEDAGVVSSWAKTSVFGLEAKGYIHGNEGKYNPKAKITRAETISIINSIVKGYYTKAGIYTDNVMGTAVIKVPNVILKGISISENLIIAEGVGKGEVTLDSVTVKGNTVVRGGGENSIHIVGTSSITNIRIETIGDKLRIVVADGNSVKEIEIATGEEIIITGTVGTMDIVASNATVYATAANISSATIKGDNSTIIVNKESKLGPVSILNTAENTSIKTEKGSVVGTVTSAAKTTISGEGAVERVLLNEGANNSSVSTPNTQTTVAAGVTGSKGGGGVALPAGSTTTNNSNGNGVTSGTPSSSGSGSGGGGGGGNPTPTVAVTGISVTGAADAITVVNGDTLQMSAVVTPANATNKTITWSVATLAGGKAIISQAGLLTATGVGTVRVTATNTASGVVGIKDITVVETISLSSIGAIVGTAKVGSELTPGSVLPIGATFRLQWKICNTAAGTYTDIVGATENKYTPVADDVGKFIKVSATGAVSQSGTSYYGTVTSEPVGPVEDSVAPVVAITDISIISATMVTFNSGISGATIKWNGVALSAKTVSGLNTITVPLMVSGVNNILVVVKSGYTTFTKNNVVWNDPLTFVKSTLSDWVTDRTEPNSWDIADNWVTYSTKTEPANNWYAWQGRKTTTNNAVTDNWKVETEFELTNDLLNRDGVRTSMWLNVLDEFGNNVDWSILQFKIDKDTDTKGWQFWNSNPGVAAWVDIDADIPTTAGVYKLAIYYTNGDIIGYINGIEAFKYAKSASKLTSVKEVIYNSYSFGTSYNVKWKVPTISCVDKYPVGTKFISTVEQLSAAIKAQADGQTWIIKAGTYDIKRDTTTLRDTNGQVVTVGGQSGWYMPIAANNLTIIGIDNPILTSSVVSANGSWASQNLITVWGNNVTLKGLTITPKVDANKSIEVVGDKQFTIEDCKFTPNTSATGALATEGGSLYFNGTGIKGTKAISIVNNNFNYTSIAFDGVEGSNITISNNTWENIGVYAIGNTYWGSADRIKTPYADVNISGNNFKNVTTGSTKIITARLNQTFKLDATNKINSVTIKKNEFEKYINFNNLAYWIGCKDNIVIVDGVTYESPYKDVDGYASDITQLKLAINAAEAGDKILFAAGDYVITETIDVNKAVTIKGSAGFSTKITTTGSNPVFKLSAAATLDGICINKTDKVNQTLVQITANGTTVKDSKFMGQYEQGDDEVVRAILPNAGTDFNITGNYFESVRQPAYLEGIGTVSNNFVKNTRGWVVCVNYAATFTNNAFEGNAVDIAIIANNQTASDNYTDVAAISEENNGAFVENQLSGLSAVNGKEAIGNVQALLSAISSAEENDILELAPTIFKITQTLHTIKPLIIKGAGVGRTILDVTGVPDKAWGVLINKSNTTLSDLTIVSTKSANYNNNLKVSDEGNTPVGHLDGIVIRNVTIQGGKGLDIHNADAIVEYVTVENSKGASIAVSNKANVTINNTITTNGAWGSLGVMENGDGSEVIIGADNVFNEGALYSEKYSVKGAQITGLSSDWTSFVNERDQLIYVKQLPQGAYITTGDETRAYTTIQAAVAEAQDDDTIMLADGTYELTSQLKIIKPITIIGSGIVTITPSAIGFNEGTYSADKHLISINGVIGLVKLENLTISNSKRSGINVWESTEVILKDIISKDNAAAGLIVNNSVVVADNLNTSGNGWGYGINVDNGASPSAGAPKTSFTLNSGTISETKQIVSDKGGVTIIAPGYSIVINDGSKVFEDNITSLDSIETLY